MKKNHKKKKVKKYAPPSLKRVMDISAPLRLYFTPQYFGLNNVNPDRPTLFVSNHTIFGILDGAIITVELYRQKGIYPRTLGDNLHYKFPIWPKILEQFGVVKGTRHNCGELMKRKEQILLFPGGGRESFKLKKERHQINWKRRTGFVHMAIQYGYDILPVASIGGDDAYNILFDSNDILHSFFGRFLIETGISEKYFKDGEYLPPIAKGLCWTGFPKPVKFYTSFGQPVETKQYEGQYTDEKVLWKVRREVELAMNKQLIDLLKYRQRDTLNPLRKLLVRF